ncbi:MULTISPECIES: hypothetical protein [Streptomyces]|nr:MULTISPECIES: hypothetical protein [Streptomyces]
MEPTPTYFLLVILDIADFGQRRNPDQAWLRERMYGVVRRALAVAGIEAAHREDRGDGILLLLPGSVPKHAVLGAFVDALEAELRGHARLHREGPRVLRLRAAMHAGEVAWDGRGWVGADLNTAFRMVDVPALKRTLEAAPKAVLSVGVSEALHRAVVRHDYLGIDPVEYRAVEFSAKELTDETLWIRVPGYLEPPGLDASGPSGGPRQDGGAPSGRAATAGPPAPAGNSGIGVVHGGIQGVGVNQGEIRQYWQPGSSPAPAEVAELKSHLEQLRAELREARSRHEIDDDTYAGATAELDEARRHTTAPDGAGRRPLLNALRRLRDLVENASGLAVTVAALIRLAGGEV